MSAFLTVSTAIWGQIKEKIGVSDFRGVKMAQNLTLLGPREWLFFFRGCIGVKLGFGCDNTKCSFKLELGLGFDNELSLAHSPNPTT